jgi:fructose-1,6-bisphosphatase/sedoheptulose 1,7-bisphosphatase-like protein
MPPRGRITGSRVSIPPARLSQNNLFSRHADMLDREALAAWNETNAELLDLYDLELTTLRQVRISEPHLRVAGPLEREHRDGLIATAALAAIAVAASGRAGVRDIPESERKSQTREIKERNDRAATCAMAEGIHALAGGTTQAVFEIAIGEGARLKPGEKGGNPTLYMGQTFGDPRHAAMDRQQRSEAGIMTYSLAVDTVEGTSKSAAGDPSAGSLLYVTEAEILRVPDVYFNKCQLVNVDGVNVDTDLGDIIEAVAAARGTRDVNIFSLKRPRHPLEEMAALGACVRTDSAGDAFPVVAAGLRWGVFEDNARPLDGICGNVGGAAEIIASAAAGHYMGIQSTARFAAKNIVRWEERYDFGPGEAEELRAAGFDPEKVFDIRDLVHGLDDKDGIFVASAITDNAHIPLFDGVLWGGNFAEVCVLTVGASGAADLFRLGFAFGSGQEKARDLLTPFMDKMLAMPVSDVGLAVREVLKDENSARRLRNEFATSFYTHFTERGGKFKLDTDSAEAVESVAAIAFMHALTDAAPDWFA